MQTFIDSDSIDLHVNLVEHGLCTKLHLRNSLTLYINVFNCDRGFKNVKNIKKQNVYSIK